MYTLNVVVVIIALLLSVLSFVSAAASSKRLILDVTGSAGDLAALRLLAASSSDVEIALVTVSPLLASSPAAAWSRTRRFLDWIGLHDVNVALGNSQSWNDRPSPKSVTSSNPEEDATCNDAGMLAPNAAPFAASAASSSSSSSSAWKDWGLLLNTCDLDSWWGTDENLSPPVAYSESTRVPGYSAASSAFAYGGFDASSIDVTDTTGVRFLTKDSQFAARQCLSPAVVAIRELLSSSPVSIDFLALGPATNLADYFKVEDALAQEIQLRYGNGDISAMDQQAGLYSSSQRLGTVHMSGGCMSSNNNNINNNAAACNAKLMSGSPKASSGAELNIALDPAAANYVLSSSSSSKTALRKKKVLFTQDILMAGNGRFTASSFALVTSRLKSMASASSSSSSGLYGGTAPLGWLGDAFAAQFNSWASNPTALKFLAANGATGLAADLVFYALRPTEMFVALAVVDLTVQRSLETKAPKYRISVVDERGVLSMTKQTTTTTTTQPGASNGEDGLVTVYSQGVTSMMGFWQRYAYLLSMAS